MIQCPWCHEWRPQDIRMRIQFCPACCDAWDPVECNGKGGDAIKQPDGPEGTKWEAKKNETRQATA